MHFQWLTEQLPSDELLATVVMDASRDTESGDRAVAARWSELRRSLDGQGITPEMSAVLEEQALQPTRGAGPHGRLIVAGSAGILMDRLLLFPPRKDEAVLSLGPDVFALAREADDTVRYLLAEVDRTGADITLYDSTSGAVGGAPVRESVDGTHDVLNKIRGGGLSHKRIESRVEDSWERNAETVAADLDRIVSERRPDLMVVTGDVRAVALVQGALGVAAKDITEHVQGGARNNGINSTFETRVDEVVEAFRVRRRTASVDRFRQELGRNAMAVTGINRVIDALRKAQVEELLISDAVAGPVSSLAEVKVWVGDKPLELSMHRDEIRQLSSGDARARRADLALGTAAAQQDAGITIVYGDDDLLTDGIGALLRWDPAKPSGVVEPG
ncbi:Vms1/Ankzf1 family peptidyl-tRNA hydrolase [Mumia sp. DW29H23]|uniref:baeRF2 domain-containing protein n=1 Tax=Mumia sp. DW29H23 TaxID=3421241 RepID=UPI003D69DA64